MNIKSFVYQLNRNCGRLLKITFFIVVFFNNISFSAASDTQIPFKAGEILEFELRWSFVKAGKAVLQVLPNKTINNVESYHFSLMVESSSFVDNFYKVRDQIYSFTNLSLTQSLLYKNRQKEGRTNRDVIVQFDWDNKKALYTNHGNPRPPLPIMDGTLDPLSAFYFLRMFDLNKEKIITRPITDGKECVIGEVRIIGKETIKFKDQEREAFLIEPDLKHVGGVFEKSKNAKIKIWISADQWKIPLRIESAVVIGSFVGELDSTQGLKE